MHGIHINNIYP